MNAVLDDIQLLYILLAIQSVIARLSPGKIRDEYIYLRDYLEQFIDP